MKRTIFATGLLSLCLSGCGFQPLYSGSSEEQQTFDIHVKGDGYSTYKFRRELEKNLAYTPKFDDEKYRLDVTVSESKSAVTYRTDASVTRNQETLSATCLISKKGQTIATSTGTIVTSYPLTPAAEYVTRVAEDAAANRSSITLAEDISRDILRQIKAGNNKLK